MHNLKLFKDHSFGALFLQVLLWTQWSLCPLIIQKKWSLWTSPVWETANPRAVWWWAKCWMERRQSWCLVTGLKSLFLTPKPTSVTQVSTCAKQQMAVGDKWTTLLLEVSFRWYGNVLCERLRLNLCWTSEKNPPTSWLEITKPGPVQGHETNDWNSKHELSTN